jgi:iron complex outermembrane receptor protein
MSIKAIFLSATAMGAALQAVPSGAEAAEQRTQATARGMEEIIVTARKREESFLDVPVVSTVLTQESLERTKTDDLYALSSRVPSLLLGNAINSVGTQVSLRGVGTTALNATMDQSVSLNIDGLPMTQGWAYGSAMFDVGQVEVLKGPQALFFGKNNTGGVISVRSADPTNEAEMTARLGYEYEAEEKVADLILSGPVSDSLKLRLATRYSDQEGFFTNESQAFPGMGNRTPSNKHAPAKNLILRGTALFAPNDAVTARLKLNYNSYRRDGVGAPLQVGYCPEGTGPVAPTNIAFMAGDDCVLNETYTLAWYDPTAFPAGLPNNGELFEDSEQMYGTLDLNFRLTDGLALTSVTGYYNNDLAMLFAGSTSGKVIGGAADIPFEASQFTQELRLTSDFTDSPVNFMVGAFYQEGEQRNEVRFPGNVRLGLPVMIQHVVFDLDINSTSFFGQLMWDITPKLELAAGARYTDEEREMTETNLNPGQGAVGLVPRPDPKISSSNVSPEVTLTYQATDDLTLFGSYKTGFKSGSFNTSTFVPSDRLASFGDEEVNGGEVGIKARALDRRLTANIAAYYYEYEDMQVGAHETSDVGGGNFVIILRTLNAATAVVKGAEFDVSYAPVAVDGLTLTASANYNHARYDSFPNAPCSNGQTISQGCNQVLNPATRRFTSQDLSGRRLVKAPEWSGYVGFDHQMPVGSMTLSFGAGANYTTEYSTTLVDRPGFEQDSFIKYDANVALRGQDDRWEVALIGANLGNELTSGFCTNSNVQNGTLFGGQIAGTATTGPAGDDEAACFVERGREAWGRFTWRFR